MSSFIKRVVNFFKHPWFVRVYLLACLLVVLAFFYLRREDISSILSTAKLHFIVLALIPYFIGIGIINPYLHKIAYKEAGNVITFWQAFRLFILSRIGCYLPGRVWYVTNYYLFSRKLNIDTTKIARNFVILNILLFLVGGLCCLPILSLLSIAIQRLLILFILLLLVLIHPRIFNKIFGIILRKKEVKSYSYSSLLIIGILYFLGYVALGGSMYLCIIAFAELDLVHMPLVIAAGASSLVIGILAIFAPAGIGVSEGISVAILSRIIPLRIAIMAVLAFRICVLFVDFICALISAISVARDDRIVEGEPA